MAGGGSAAGDGPEAPHPSALAVGPIQAAVTLVLVLMLVALPALAQEEGEEKGQRACRSHRRRISAEAPAGLKAPHQRQSTAFVGPLTVNGLATAAACVRM